MSCDELSVIEYSGYRVQGNYVEKTDMAATNAYALYNGMFYYSTNPAKTLKPFRIFLTINKVINAPVRMTVDGKEVSGIYDLLIDPASAPAYNLQGLPVDDNYKGIIIINGQKVMRQ